MLNEDNNVLYFRKELGYLNDMRDIFTKRYPKIAPFLSQDSNDPDVEKIIENLALLTSRIRQELDENIPSIADSLVNILVPNYMNQFPSFCIQEFAFKNPDSNQSTLIPKGTEVYGLLDNGIKCIFKTIYDVFVHPIAITNVFIGTIKNDYILNFDFNVNAEDVKLNNLNIEQLNLFVGKDVYSPTLIMWLMLYLKEIIVLCPDTNQSFKLNNDDIHILGLDERAIKYDDFGFEAYSMLQELFFMSEKFNFINIKNLKSLKNFDSKRFTIKFIFKQNFPNDYLPRIENFSLTATPAINLFKSDAEPITNNNKTDTYRIFLNRENISSSEVIQITRVIAHDSSNRKKRRLKNYKSFERFAFFKENGLVDYYSIKNKIDSSKNHYKEISFYSKSKIPEVITIEALCCNADLPKNLKIAQINHIQNFEHIITKNTTIPTKIKRVNVDGNVLWQLISVLSFSYKTMLEKDSFLAVLNAFSPYEDKQTSENIANCIVDIKSKPIYRLSNGEMKKGTLCVIFIDDDKFYSIGEIYIIGLVFSKFLSSFASINSFCELKVKCVKSSQVLAYKASDGLKTII
ncbi:MAG: type VI secretion system baseplate subunit TssF [Campylobacter sp.]|nr:type VI secretion system baseplate subunit TssF [Campylobacter sp.]